MKNKIAMIAAVTLLAIGMTGCGMGKSPEKTMTGEEIKMMNKHYKNFTQSEFDTLRGSKKFIAFFHADWCSTCKKWEKKLLSALPEMPADAVVLKVNYDEEEALKKELGVKSQSTAIFFDEKGNIIDTVIDPDMNKVKAFFESMDSSIEVAEEKMMNKEESVSEKDEIEPLTEAVKEEVLNKEENTSEIDEVEGSTEIEEEIIDKEESVSKVNETELVVAEGEKIADYSAAKKTALTGQKHIVFFYADWCPTCRRWKASVEESLAELPTTTKILIANYDEETELKKEFKITTQSMAVLINEDGSFESKSDPKVEVIQAFFSN